MEDFVEYFVTLSCSTMLQYLYNTNITYFNDVYMSLYGVPPPPNPTTAINQICMNPAATIAQKIVLMGQANSYLSDAAVAIDLFATSGGSYDYMDVYDGVVSAFGGVSFIRTHLEAIPHLTDILDEADATSNLFTNYVYSQPNWLLMDVIADNDPCNFTATVLTRQPGKEMDALANTYTLTQFLTDIETGFGSSVRTQVECGRQTTQTYVHQKFTLNELHIFGSSRIGINKPNRLLKNVSYQTWKDSLDCEWVTASTASDTVSYTGVTDSIYSRYIGWKNYELSNHLGNVLVTLSDWRLPQQHGTYSDTIKNYQPEVLTAQDYYAFGALMPGRTYSLDSATYRLGFNGMERDDELNGDGNSYDFNFRAYDTRIGRFLSVDPLQKNFPFSTPYSYAQNSCIKFKDLEGQELYVTGTAADNFINMLSQRTGLVLTADANGMLTYATTLTVTQGDGTAHNQTPTYTVAPVINPGNSDYVSVKLREEVMTIINGGISLNPVWVIAETSSNIASCSHDGKDNIVFDQFPYLINNSMRSDDMGEKQFDNYVDMTDFENIGNTPELQAALIDHLISERSVKLPTKSIDYATANSNFQFAHNIGILFESEIIREVNSNAQNRNIQAELSNIGKSATKEELFGFTFDYGSVTYKTKFKYDALSRKGKASEVSGAVKK